MKGDSLYVAEDFVSKILNKDKIKTVIELGARDCDDTPALERIYPTAQIYSIECNPHQADTCKKNLEKTNRTTFIQKAITNYSGWKNFYVYPDTEDNPMGHGSSSLYDHVEDFMTITSVQCTTGKQLVKEYNLSHIDVLCMDIQGSEYEALLSFEDFINNIDYIIFEDDAHRYKKPVQNCLHTFLKNNKFELIHHQSDYLYKRIF